MVQWVTKITTSVCHLVHQIASGTLGQVGLHAVVQSSTKDINAGISVAVKQASVQTFVGQMVFAAEKVLQAMDAMVQWVTKITTSVCHLVHQVSRTKDIIAGISVTLKQASVQQTFVGQMVFAAEKVLQAMDAMVQWVTKITTSVCHLHQARTGKQAGKQDQDKLKFSLKMVEHPVLDLNLKAHLVILRIHRSPVLLTAIVTITLVAAQSPVHPLLDGFANVSIKELGLVLVMLGNVTPEI